MSDVTVTPESGTITTTETPAAVVTHAVEKKEVTPPTFKEAEAAYRASFDKSRGRDITKLFPNTAPKPAEPAKVEAKTEAKPDAKVEVKPAVAAPPSDAPHKPSTFQRRMTKINRELGAAQERNRILEARLSALETKPNGHQAGPVVVEEPKRDQFQTDADYFTALRRFDKEQLAAETKKISDQRAAEDSERDWNAKIKDFTSRLAVAKAKHDDWDEKTRTTTVAFNPMLQGVLMTADPELLYHFASTPRDARNLNDMSETSVVAAGNADDVTGVLRWLSSHPDDIDRLNGLNPVKAQTFIGKIEAKIEAGSATPVKDEAKPVPEVKPSPGGVAAQPVVEAVRVEPATRNRPEPPPKLTGAAPSPADWRDPANMSMSERERLMREDPRYRKR